MQVTIKVANNNNVLVAQPTSIPTLQTTAIGDLTRYSNTTLMLANVATAYTNAVNYTISQSYANTSQVSGNAATSYANSVAFASNASNITTGTLPYSVLGANVVLSTQLQGNLSNYALLSGAVYSGQVNVTTFNTSGNTNIGGNLSITGNFTVGGNVSVIGANNLSIVDNMIYLNSNAVNANPDIGIASGYNDGTYHHTGFFRDHATGTWKVFDNYVPEPDASIYIDQTNSTFHVANFQANVFYVGNNSVYGTVNTTNYSGTANNASYLGGVTLSTIRDQITGNAASAYSNGTTYSSNASNITTGTLPYSVLGANVVNTSSAFTITGIHTHNANMVMNAASIGFGNTIANATINTTSIMATNVNFTLTSSGGDLNFSSQGGVCLTIPFTGGTITNPILIAGSAGGFPIIGANNSGLGLVSANGDIKFNSAINGSANPQLRILHTASSVNYLTLTGAIAGGHPLLAAAGNDTNVSISIAPKGTGAFYLGPVADSTATGGNPRGAGAVDLQLTRSANTYVASGQYSIIAGGANNRSAGTGSVVSGGLFNTAGTDYCTIGGGANNTVGAFYGTIAGGFKNATDNNFCWIPGGQAAITHGIYGAGVGASGLITVVGDAQWGKYILRSRSASGAAVRLFADGAGTASSQNIINVPLNTAWTGDFRIIARDTSTGNSGRWSGTFGLSCQATNATCTWTTTSIEWGNVIGAVTQPGLLTITADTIFRGANVMFQAPNKNTWDIVAVFDTGEVQ